MTKRGERHGLINVNSTWRVRLEAAHVLQRSTGGESPQNVDPMTSRATNYGDRLRVGSQPPSRRWRRRRRRAARMDGWMREQVDTFVYSVTRLQCHRRPLQRQVSATQQRRGKRSARRTVSIVMTAARPPP